METTIPNDNTWHRQPVIWFVISLLASAVIASFTLLYVALKNAPELSVADYSNIVNIAAERNARLSRAGELGLTAVLEFSGETPAQVKLHLRSSSAVVWPEILSLQLIHTTLGEYDRESILHGSDGRYSGIIELPPGAFVINVEDLQRTWQLGARTHTGAAQLELQARTITEQF